MGARDPAPFLSLPLVMLAFLFFQRDRSGREEREKEREEHIDVRETREIACLLHAPRDGACNGGTCP